MVAFALQRVTEHPYTLSPIRTAHNANAVYTVADLLADVRPLFQGGQDDNLSDDTTDDDNLFVLSEWTNQTKNKKLSKVTDPLARNLLSQILHR